jgi:hypothetical protein
LVRPSIGESVLDTVLSVPISIHDGKVIDVETSVFETSDRVTLSARVPVSAGCARSNVSSGVQSNDPKVSPGAKRFSKVSNFKLNADRRVMVLGRVRETFMGES